MDIYLNRRGETLGPYSIQALRKRFVLGDIGPEELACEEGGTEWKPIHQFLEARKPRRKKVRARTLSDRQTSVSAPREDAQDGELYEPVQIVRPADGNQDWLETHSGKIFLPLALFLMGLWMVGDQWQSVRGIFTFGKDEPFPTGIAVIGAGVCAWSSLAFCYGVLQWIADRFFANVSGIGTLLIIAGIVVGIRAVSLSPGNAETSIRHLVADLEQGRNGVEAMRNVSQALGELMGSPIDASQADSQISTQERKIQYWREELRDHVARRESDKMTFLIISGILLVVGAITLKRTNT